MDSGRIAYVQQYQSATVLTSDYASGLTLYVNDTGVFNELGGTLVVGSEARSYEQLDDELGTVTLAAPLSGPYAAGTTVSASPVTTTFYAIVELDDAGGSIVHARIPHSLVMYLGGGTSVAGLSNYQVSLGYDSLGWYVMDVIGSVPVGTGSYIDPNTLVFTDGEPPASSPTPTVEGGVGFLNIRWPASTNADFTWYEVHISTTTGFTPSESTLAGLISGTGFVIRKMPNNDALVIGTTYYVKLVARDADGLGPVGTQGSGQIAQVSDGNPPASSPTPTVYSGIGYLAAVWDAVANNDPVTYEVHISATTGFTPSGSTLYAEIVGTSQFIRKLADGNPLVEGTTYYVKLIAKDSDGSAAASAQGSGSITVLTTTDVDSDGSAPASSPTPTLEGGFMTLLARWTPITNADYVTYEVHLGTSAGFTPGAGTKVGETGGGSFVITKANSSGGALVYGTAYYCKLIAKDADGSAAASTASAAASLVRSTTADIDPTTRTNLSGENLVTNGNAELGTLLNWTTAGPMSAVETSQVDAPSGDKVFSSTTSQTGGNVITSDDFIPVDRLKPHTVSGWAKRTTAVTPHRMYVGVAEYDRAGNYITAQSVYETANTQTTVVGAYSQGDTSITVASGANWSSAAGQYFVCNATSDRSDKPNYSLAIVTAVNGNVITLQAPGLPVSLSDGAPVREHHSGNGYNYIAASNVDVNATWTKYVGILQGEEDAAVQSPTAGKFRRGTRYVRFLILANRDGVGTKTTYFDDLTIAAATSTSTVVSDGSAPASSPTPTLQGAVGFLVAKWLPATNEDLVTYEVHLGTSSGFTPGAGTKVGETTGTSFVVNRADSGGASLAYSTDYYCKLIAKDSDGSAAAGTASAAAQLVQVANADISGVSSAKVATNGSAPSSSPTPTLQSGFNFLAVKWTPVTNPDPVTYEVHVGTSSGFTPSASTKIFETTGTSGIINKADSSGTALAYGTSYYSKIVAKDADGSAAASTASGAAQLTQVGATDITDSSITTDKIAANTIVAGDIAANTITAAEIAADAITASEIAANTITAAEIAAGTITSTEIAANTIVAGDIAANTITAAEIAADAITASELAAGAVTTAKLLVMPSPQALTPDPVFLDSTAWTKYQGADATFATVTDAPMGTHVMRSGGTGTSWYNSLKVPIDPNRTYRIRTIVRRSATGNGTVYGGVALFDSSGANIAGDGSQWYYYPLAQSLPDTDWHTYEIQFGYGTAKTFPSNARTMAALVILNYNGTAGNMEANYAGIEMVSPATLIQDGAITTDKIAANAVTAAEIAAGTITATQIAAGTITGTEIAAATITADNLAAGILTADLIAAGSITADKLAAGTITAESGVIGSIAAEVIQSGTLNASLTISGSMKTSQTGRRVEIDASGIRLIDTGGSTIVDLPTAAYEDARFAGQVEAAALDVTGAALFHGDTTLASGATITLASKVQDPTTGPSITVDWPATYDVDFDEPHGMCYDSAGGGAQQVHFKNVLVDQTDTDASSYQFSEGALAAGAIDLLVVESATSGGAAANTPTVTSTSGRTWTNVAAIAFGTKCKLSVFRSMGAAVSSGVLTIDFASQTQTVVTVSIDEGTNVDTGGTNGANAVVQSGTVTTAATLARVPMSPFGDAGNSSFIAASARAAAANPNWLREDDWTDLGTASIYGESSAAYHSLTTAWVRDPDVTPTMACSGADGFAAIGLEIKPALSETSVASFLVAGKTAGKPAISEFKASDRSLLRTVYFDIAHAASTNGDDRDVVMSSATVSGVVRSGSYVYAVIAISPSSDGWGNGNVIVRQLYQRTLAPVRPRVEHLAVFTHATVYDFGLGIDGSGYLTLLGIDHPASTYVVTKIRLSLATPRNLLTLNQSTIL